MQWWVVTSVTWLRASLGNDGVIARGRAGEGVVVHGDVVLLPQRCLIEEHDASAISRTAN